MIINLTTTTFVTIIINVLIQFIFASVATLSFSIIFCAPRKEIIFCGITGGFGWIIYYILNNYVHYSIIVAALIATAGLAIISRAFAVIRMHPATIYILPGIFPLVPGAGIYYTAYYLITKQHALFAQKGLETFEIASAIVFGIIFGFAIPQSLFAKIGKVFHHEMN